MSASREKKQRQSAGPSEKALKAQQEQAARRRSTIIYSAVAAVVAVLVAALLIWRSGFFQGRASAATVGGETLTTAQLSYYYHSVRNSLVPYSSMIGFDTTKRDSEQFYNASEGVTYRDYFMETALTSAQENYALAAEAVKLGHTEDEVKDSLAAAIQNAKSSATASGYSYAAYLRALYGPYMSAGVFEQELTRALMASLIKNEKTLELSDGYTEADLTAYYEGKDSDGKENAASFDTFEYSCLTFTPASVETKDKDGNELPEDEVEKLKDDAKAEAKEKAQEALEAVKSGSSFASQIEKYELSATTSFDHSKVVGSGRVSSAYQEQLLKLDKGACELVETDSAFYVISFHDRYLEDAPTRDVRHILARAETTTDESGNVVAPTDEAWAAAKEKMDAIQAEWDSGAKTEDAFAELANAKSDDGNGTTGGLYPKIDAADGYVPEFLEWIFTDGRKPGDTGVVQHVADDADNNKYYGYHLMYYVGENEPLWMRTARDVMSDSAYHEWQDSLTANYPTAEAGGASYLGK